MEDYTDEIIKAIKESDIMPDYSEDREITMQAIIELLPDITESEKFEIIEFISQWDKAQIIDGFKGTIRISKECFK
jgi:hypothetical protein